MSFNRVFKYTKTPYPPKDGYRSCILTKMDIDNKPKMEKKLLLKGFDLEGEVEITEVKEGKIWQYQQKR